MGKSDRYTVLINASFIVRLLGTLIFVFLAPQQVLFAQINTTLSDTIIANQYFQYADKLLKEVHYDSSRIYFDKASRIYEQTNAWDKYVQCLNKISDSFLSQSQNDSAMNFTNKSLAVGLEKLGEKHPVIASCYINIGKVYYARNNLDKALHYYQKALSTTIECLGDNNPITASTYDLIGWVLIKEDDFDRALQIFLKALSIRLGILDEKHPDVATSYSNLGSAYMFKGDYDKCLQYYQKALSVRLATLGDMHPVVANTYHDIGVRYSNCGDYDKALEYYQKALSIRLSISSAQNPTTAFYNMHIGYVYRNKGNYDKALEYYQKALSIYLNVIGEKQFNVGVCCYRIGDVYCENGVYDKAIQFYQKSISIFSSILSKKNTQVAINYCGLGAIYLKTGDYDKALQFYQKGLLIHRKAFGEKHAEVVETYQNLGNVYLKKNNPVEALKYFQKSIISLAQDFKDTNIYANPALRKISSEQYLLSSLELKAEALEKLYSTKSKNLKDLKYAESTYELASILLGNIRKSYQSEDSKLDLGERASIIYNKAISTALRLYKITHKKEYKEKAFAFSERSKAFLLLQSLSESKAKQFAGIPGDLLEKEKNIKIDLAFYEKTLFEEQVKGKKAEKSKIIRCQDKLFSLNREYEALTQRFENEYPEYYNLKYKTYTISPKEIQAKLLNKDNALVEYFTGDTSIYIFTLTQHTFDVTTIKRDTFFNAQINSMREGLIKRKYDVYVDNAYRLYQRLIEPIKTNLTNKNLIIITDGILGYIPFETLLTKQPDSKNKDYRQLAYLIKDNQITYDYSATLLFENITTEKKKSQSHYVGFAPVTFK